MGRQAQQGVATVLALLAVVGGVCVVGSGLAWYVLADFSIDHGPGQRGPYESAAIILGGVLPGVLLVGCGVVAAVGLVRGRAWPVWCARAVLAVSAYLAACGVALSIAAGGYGVDVVGLLYFVGLPALMTGLAVTVLRPT